MQNSQIQIQIQNKPDGLRSPSLACVRLTHSLPVPESILFINEYLEILYSNINTEKSIGVLLQIHM